MAREDGATTLLAPPESGRTFTSSRRVRLSDTTADGELRLDGLARFIQDVASDDARETMTASYLAWVVRRTLVEVHRAPVSEELVELTTWCSGYGGRWAERRTSIRGELGGHCETVVLWVAIDPASGAPARLPEEFHAAYDEASRSRKVTARLQHPDVDAEAQAASWRFRVSDVDRLGHVNNAAYWSVVEERLSDGARPTTMAAEMEYRDPVDAGVELGHVATVDAGRPAGWLLHDSGVAASYRLRF